MNRITRELPNLVNGVSQQHPQLRMRSQGDEVVNMTPSLVHGLRTRLPIEHVKRIKNSFQPTTTFKTHLVPRGSGSPQFLLFYNNTIERFSDTGESLPLTITNNAYLTAPDPENGLVVKTIADTTFVVNKRIAPGISSSQTPERTPRGIVFVKLANYQTTYTLTINGVASIYTTPHGVGTETNPPQQISTETIAQGLATGSQMNMGQTFAWPSGYLVQSSGSLILITAPSAAHLNYVKISDSRGDSQMYLITDKVNNYSELPAKAPNGFTTKVVGGAGAEDDYYVRFYADDVTQLISTGTWRECEGPGLWHAWDLTTMPHTVTVSSNSAHFGGQLWQPRKVGDNDTNPWPSFVSKPINDIFFYRNRLGFLAGDNVVLSCAGDFFNFFLETARTITDGDPIDYAASQEEVHGLLYAVPFQEELLLFSDRAQFALSSSDVLAPSTPVVKHISSNQIRGKIRPVIGSKTLFFCSDEEAGAEGTRLKEFYFDLENEVRETSDITAHTPKYIPVAVKRVLCNTGKDLVFILPENGRELYIYKYFWSGKEKIQSAWFKYTLPSGCFCKSIETHENTLYLFNMYGSELHLEKMSLEYDLAFTEEDYPYCVDRLFTSTGLTRSYSSTTEKTTYTGLPYSVDPYTLKVIEKYTGLECPIDTDKSTATSIVLYGNVNTPLVIGYPYVSYYQFSDQYMKTEPENGYAVTTGRLQYRCWKITYGLSGGFTVDVYPNPKKNIDPTTNPPVSSAVVGTTKNGVGSAVLKEGVVRIGVYANAQDVKIRVTTQDHLPMSIVSAAWEGIYATRAGRVA